MGKIIALMAALTISTPASAYVETICLTRDKEPILVQVRADKGVITVKGGDGPWHAAATPKVTEDSKGVVYFHVKSVNKGGTMVITFSPENNAGLVTFDFPKEKRTAQYDATCATINHN